MQYGKQEVVDNSCIRWNYVVKSIQIFYDRQYLKLYNLYMYIYIYMCVYVCVCVCVFVCIRVCVY